jgi:putative MATE family efflux protein
MGLMPPGENAPMLRDELDRRIVRLAIPALGTLAIEPLYILVDTAIVGRISTDALAGLAIAATVLLTVASLATFLEYGVTPDVAFAHGIGETDTARRAASDALTLAVILGTLGGAFLALAAHPLCWLLGGRGQVLEYAVLYLRISAVGLPFVLIAFVGHGVMRGLNDLRKPLIIVVVANAANIVLELVAVYGLQLGVAGSAWSTVIVQAAAAVWFVVILRPHTIRVRPSWARYRPMLITGSHLAVRSLAMYAVWNSSTFVAAHIDTPTLAANQVLVQLFNALALTLDALAIPAQSLVAGALGAGDVPEATRVGNSSTRLSLWFGGGLAVLLAVTSPFLPHVFTTDPAVQSRLTGGLLILAVMQFPGAIAFALDGALIGAHDERFLGRAAVLNLAGYFPIAALTLAFPVLGIVGLWTAQLTWMSMRATVNGLRWRSQRWTVHLLGRRSATIAPA